MVLVKKDTVKNTLLYEIIPLFHFVENSLTISYSFPVAINVDLFGREQRSLLVNSPVKKVQGTFFTSILNKSRILSALELNKGKLIGFPCSWYPIPFRNATLIGTNIVELENSFFDFWEAFKIFNITAYNLKTNEYEVKEIWYISDDGLNIYCYQPFEKNFPREYSLVYPLELFLIKDINIKEETKTLFYIDLNLEEKYHTAIEPRLPRIKPFFDNHNFYPFTKFFKIKINTPAPYNIQYLFEIDKDNLKIWKNDLTDVLYDFDISLVKFWENIRENGEDLRIIYNVIDTNTGYYDYDETFFYIEEFNYANKYAKLWVLIPQNSTELYFYYGNKNALMSIANNPYQVFEFFEDFSKTNYLDNYKWYCACGEYEIKDNALIFSHKQDNLWSYIRTKKPFSYGIWIDYKIGYAGDTGTKWDGLRLSPLDNSRDSEEYSLKNDKGPYIGFGEGITHLEETAGVGDGVTTFIEGMGCPSVGLSDWDIYLHKATILWNIDKIILKKQWYDNCSYEKVIINPIPTVDMFIVFGIRTDIGKHKKMYIYELKIRKYIENDLEFVLDI